MAILPLLVAAISMQGSRLELLAKDAVVIGGLLKDGYVTDFSGKDAEIRWRFEAKPGIYRARVNVRATSEKGFGFEVNGRSSGGMFKANPSFVWQDAGLVELTKGKNTVAVKRGWGYYEVAAIDFSLAQIPKMKPVSGHLVSPKPLPVAQLIMNRLSKSYGKQTWSGQYEPKDTEFIQQKTGRTPAIFGADFMDSSPSRAQHGAKQSPSIKDLITVGKKGSVLTLSWHWNAPSHLLDTKEQPWYKGFYKDATSFDLAAALADPKSADYKLLIRDMDAIAKLLKQFQDQGIPILWRPLHEAEGGWFWWGAKGADPCKKLWRLMYDRYTRVHGLRNLIWVWNSSSPDWYPGDDTVDIIAIDRYPDDRSDALTSDWGDLLKRFDGKKKLAIGEFPGAPDVDRMAKFGVKWAYFVSWTGDLGPKGMKEADLKRIYGSRWIVNRK